MGCVFGAEDDVGDSSESVLVFWLQYNWSVAGSGGGAESGDSRGSDDREQFAGDRQFAAADGR